MKHQTLGFLLSDNPNLIPSWYHESFTPIVIIGFHEWTLDICGILRIDYCHLRFGYTAGYYLKGFCGLP